MAYSSVLSDPKTMLCAVLTNLLMASRFDTLNIRGRKMWREKTQLSFYRMPWLHNLEIPPFGFDRMLTEAQLLAFNINGGSFFTLNIFSNCTLLRGTSYLRGCLPFFTFQNVELQKRIRFAAVTPLPSLPLCIV